MVRKIKSTDASGNGAGDMNICDPNGQPLCESISYASAIHIELLLTMSCDNERMRNDIRCDLDDMLNMTLADIAAETSTPVIPCTMLNANGMDCRALVTVLDNSTVSQNLTQQLFEQLVTNRSNTTVSTGYTV